MLQNVVVGWEKIEAPFLANIATRKPFILLGRHGTCKTTCAKLISHLQGEDGFRFFDATKDDLVSIAGIPIPERLSQGKLDFSAHERSIWDAKVIVVDELTRANKENQNLWLEILEERTCFGKPLNYDTFIATMNPESYASTFKLDQALLDRFHSVLPVPELQQGTGEQFKKLLGLNFQKGVRSIDNIKDCSEQIKKNYQRLKEEHLSYVIEYVSTLMELLLPQKPQDIYVSPRKSVQLADEILAIGAYHRYAKKEKYLEEGAKQALIYTLSVPLKIDPKLLLKIHGTLKGCLSIKGMSKTEKLRAGYAKLASLENKVKYIEENIEEMAEQLNQDEMEKMVSTAIEDAISKEKNQLLIPIRDALAKVCGFNELKRRVEGNLVILIDQEIRGLCANLNKAKAYNNQEYALLMNANKAFSNCQAMWKSKSIQAILLESSKGALSVIKKLNESIEEEEQIADDDIKEFPDLDELMKEELASLASKLHS